jgi:hypothetical protein
MLYVASEAADNSFKGRKTTSISLDSLRFVIDVENGSVLGFSRLGEWWPEFRNVEEPISTEMFVREFADVPEEDAIRATRDFIEEHFGKNAISKLAEPSVSKTDFSVGYYYSVVWKDKPNSGGFYKRKLGFRFAVDPVSGKLMRGIFDTVELQSLPRMSFDDVSGRRKSILHRLESLSALRESRRGFYLGQKMVTLSGACGSTRALAEKSIVWD